MNDVSGNENTNAEIGNDSGSAQPVIINTETRNASEFQGFGYADYMQMYWGGFLNGIFIGCLIALLSVTICKLFDVTRNVESKGE